MTRADFRADGATLLRDGKPFVRTFDPVVALALEVPSTTAKSSSPVRPR
jgi:hypothetical protein